MLRYFYVTSDEDLADLIERQEPQGYRLAAISNAGCQPGITRVVFAPESVFKSRAKGAGQ